MYVCTYIQTLNLLVGSHAGNSNSRLTIFEERFHLSREENTVLQQLGLKGQLKTLKPPTNFTTTSWKSLPRRARMVFLDKKYPLDPKHLSLPKAPTGFASEHYVAILGRRYFIKVVQMYSFIPYICILHLQNRRVAIPG